MNKVKSKRAYLLGGSRRQWQKFADWFSTQKLEDLIDMNALREQQASLGRRQLLANGAAAKDVDKLPRESLFWIANAHMHAFCTSGAPGKMSAVNWRKLFVKMK